MTTAQTTQAPLLDATPFDPTSLLLDMVRAVVYHPDHVEISTTFGREITVLTISVDPEDMSHLIGRDHRTISALRHLIAKSAAMNGRKAIVNLDIQHELEAS